MPGCAAWTQPNLGFQRWFSAPGEAAKRAFQPLAAATLQVGKFTPPYISQFRFYGWLNPSKLLIIWPNLKNHPKWKIFKKHFKFWQKKDCSFKPGSATSFPCHVFFFQQLSGLQARCRARKSPRGLDALRRGRGQPPCGLQWRKWRHHKPVMAS